jgi:transcriptional regulator with PAS, ATPase and Fis domain
LSNNIGHALAHLGRFDEAEEWLAEAFKIDNESPHLFNKGGFLQTLGYVYLKTGRVTEAETLLRKSASILKRFSQPRLLTSTILYLSETLERMHKYTEAREQAERALKLATRVRSESLCSEATERLATVRRPLLRSSELKTTTLSIVSVSDLMRVQLHRVAVLAPTSEVVLILGETGTGKELIANAIHRESKRSHAPFIPFNCSALSRDMIESRLFGHRKGAFTGASQDQIGVIRAARGGSLFLDEIGDLSLEAQGALLRFLQSGEIQPIGASTPIKVDVRVIAATNRNLAQEAYAGRFRKDLYYRLNGVTLTIPPLRSRPEDIGPLVRHFAAEMSKRYGVLEPIFTRTEIERLCRYPWPGNVRELQSYVKCLTLFGAKELPTPEVETTDSRPSWYRLNDAQKNIALVNALRESGGNVTAAARLLGISRRTIQLRRRQHKSPD